MIRCKNSFSTVLFFCSFLIQSLMSGNTFAQLETNGSFEDSEPGSITDLETGVNGWLIQLMDGAEADFQVVAGIAQEGNHSLGIVAGTLGTNQWSIQAIADSIPVNPGDTYNYSIWAKSKNGGAQVNFTVGNYSFNEYNAIRPANLTTEWQEFTMEFTVSDAQTVIRAPIHVNYAANAGDSIYIDNLRIYNPEDLIKPVIVEAESGVTGSYFSTEEDGDIGYITTTVNFTGTASPEDTGRVATYNVTFPDTGYYSLFARLRVGPGSFDDDSFFYPRGFGAKSDTASADWVFVNGLAAAGFSDPSAIVDEPGGVGSEEWKWVNLSNNTYSGVPGDTFLVSVDSSLTKIFQIASREDGLWFDKFAFGKTYLRYTVENLDSVEAGSLPDPIEVWEGPPLATNQPKFVGNIYSPSQIQNFEAYWNKVTPENAGKWASVEGTRDNMNWGGLDASYNLARDNGFPFHFHVLIWGAQQPAWINSLSPEEQLEEITEWFQAVAERYPDIEFLEVVNEALPGHNPPDGLNGRANYKEALGGDGETGWDWVLNSFRMAREIFPAETKLMLNDYSIINSTNSTAQYLELIRLLQDENLVDIIGEQGHAFTTTASVIIMRRNLDSLATTGLPVHITELDIDGIDDQVQLQDYQRIFPTLYEHPGVEGITLWGWRRGLWRDDQGAYLINQNGSERPSMVWLREYLDSVNVVVSVEHLRESPQEFQLYANYPNPFNPTTTISYNIPAAAHVKLQIYDVLGREVVTLVNTRMQAGIYDVNWNGKNSDGINVVSGTYFFRLVAGDNIITRKMILLK